LGSDGCYTTQDGFIIILEGDENELAVHSGGLEVVSIGQDQLRVEF
jgi:hypothetical protein